MLTVLIHMYPSIAMAYFRPNQNYVSVQISTTILKSHILSRQGHKHMSKVQGHCGIAKEKIKQQSFSFEECCSHCRNRPQSPVRLIRREELIFSKAHMKPKVKSETDKGHRKKPREPTTHISLEENNTSEWEWALTWTCNHTPPILNIQTPRATSSSDLQIWIELPTQSSRVSKMWKHYFSVSLWKSQVE